MSYSLDFRKRIFELKEKELLTYNEVATRFGIGMSTLMRWSKKLEPQLTRNKPATKIDMEALKKDIVEFPDAYQYERAERFGVSQRGIGKALKRLGISLKKKTLSHPRADEEKKRGVLGTNQEIRG
ncbi:hypothetical protein CCP3SC5AM1_760001 [Gammaproteobacteria bacterium]